MQLRLAARGADTMAALWAMPAEHMAMAWGGKSGRHFWRNLHGEHVVEPSTRRHSIGHSSVLSPQQRTEAGAFAILIRLVHKVAARLRSMHYAAGSISLHIEYEDHTAWGSHLRLADAQDTQTLIEAMSHLWEQRPHSPRGSVPKKVGIVLFDLELTQNVTLSLFESDARRLELGARAMDHINARYGRQ